MTRKLMTLIIVTILVMFIFAGCQNKGDTPPKDEELTGKDVPEYKVLLDPEYLTRDLQSEIESATGADKESLELVDELIGYLDWEVTSLEAKESDGTIGVRSIAKFSGDDESLSGFLNKVEPAKADVIKGFTHDDILMMFSIGNFEGGLNNIMDWVLNTDAVDKVMGVASDDPKAVQMWNTMKPMIIGINEMIKEKLYTYIGDEFTFALYYNQDFIGWEGIDDAESFYEASPVRFLIAFSLEKAGMAEDLLDILDELVMNSPMGLMMGGMGGGSLFPDAERDKSGNYDIFYMHIEGDFQLAWAEYEGAMFISDMNTIKNLGDYYDPKKPASVPSTYNNYFLAEIDNCIEKFYQPFEDDIAEGWEDAQEEIEDVEIRTMVDDIFTAIDDGDKFGAFESYTYNSKDGWVSTINLTSVAGPHVLNYFEAMKAIGDVFTEIMEEEMGGSMMGGDDYYY